MNATRHGLCARTTVPGAGGDKLAAPRAAVLMRRQPVDAAEAQQVQVRAPARDAAESGTNEPTAAVGGASENYTNELAPCTNEPCLVRVWQKGGAPPLCRGVVRGVGDRNEPRDLQPVA